MMGRQLAQDALFYEFSLEQAVPTGHLVRKLDQQLDFSNLHAKMTEFYSHTGRPSIDPELMVRMLIIGYCFGIRSERRLCDEVSMNLAYRWFCRLGLEGGVPHHSTFSHNRYGRFEESGILRNVFEGLVARCLSKGLIDGQMFATDASVIPANASYAKALEGETTENADANLRAVKGYFDTLDDAAFGAATNTKKKLTSQTDPAAQWTSARGKPGCFAYSTNYLTDCKNSIIVDVEGSRAIRTAEVTATQTMIERTQEVFGLKPESITADSAYGSGQGLNWFTEREIDPYVPVWDKSERKNGTFARDDFEWDAENNRYICPEGKTLKTTGTVHSGTTLFYFTGKADCADCPLKAKCCPNTPTRKLSRHIHEAARERAKALVASDHYEVAKDNRKKVEMRFAHLKETHNFRRLRLRGPTGARQEFLLAAIAQNLRRMVQIDLKRHPT